MSEDGIELGYTLGEGAVEAITKFKDSLKRMRRERDDLLATNQRLLREAEEDHAAILALSGALDELATNGHVASWIQLATADLAQKHTVAIARAHGQPGGEALDMLGSED